MPGTAGGNLGLVWGFNAGEDGWGDSYNDNHKKLDSLVQMAVVVWSVHTPPVSPAAGAAYVLGGAPTGVWAGHAFELAVFYDEWTFYQPKPGWRAYNRDTNRFFYWKESGGWTAEKHLYDGDYGDVIVGDLGTTITIKTANFVAVATRGQPNGVATLDGGGKIPAAQLPAIAITNRFVVASQAAQVALVAETGDVAIRTDQSKSYIHNGGTAGSMADWNELLTPTDIVLSVAGKTGAVSLVKADVGLGSVDNTSDAAKLASWATLASLQGLTLVAGDMFYSTGPGVIVRLPKGTAGQILAMNAGATAPEWQTGAGGGGLPAASQAEQEAASSTAVAVTPGRQHFHPSAAKAWAAVTVSAGTPTLAASYNITSISDAGVGQLGVTIATDFSSSTWASLVSTAVGTKYGFATWTTKAAGTISLQNVDNTETFTDPAAWTFAGYGDQ